METFEELAKKLNAIIGRWTLGYECIAKDSTRAAVRCKNGRTSFSSSVIEDVVQFCKKNRLDYAFYLTTDSIIEILIFHK